MNPYTFAAMWAGISGATLLVIALVVELRQKRPAVTLQVGRPVDLCARLSCRRRWTRSINGWRLCDACATGIHGGHR